MNKILKWLAEVEVFCTVENTNTEADEALVQSYMSLPSNKKAVEYISENLEQALAEARTAWSGGKAILYTKEGKELVEKHKQSSFNKYLMEYINGNS